MDDSVDTADPFSRVAGPADAAARRLHDVLTDAGLRVVQSFRLHDARRPASDIGCPKHDGLACDCELIILLVYAQTGPPATIVLNGSDGTTMVSLVAIAGQQEEPALHAIIASALRNNPA